MELTMKQKLMVGLVSVLISIVLAAYFVEGMDKITLQVAVLGMFLVANCAYYFTTNRQGTARWLVFSMLLSAPLAFYLMNSFLFRHSLDPRILIGCILLLLTVMNVVSLLRRRVTIAQKR